MLPWLVVGCLWLVPLDLDPVAFAHLGLASEIIDGEAWHKLTMSEHLIREAEFLLSVSTENSTDKLRAMLKPFNPNRDIPILNRLNELYERQNLNVLLRVASRYWTEGMDDEAASS